METRCFGHGTADEGLSCAPGSPSSFSDLSLPASRSIPLSLPPESNDNEHISRHCQCQGWGTNRSQFRTIELERTGQESHTLGTTGKKKQAMIF